VTKKFNQKQNKINWTKISGVAIHGNALKKISTHVFNTYHKSAGLFFSNNFEF